MPTTTAQRLSKQQAAPQTMHHSHLPLILLGALLTIPTTTNTAASKKHPLQAFCTTLTTPNTPILGHPSNLTFACPSNPAFSARQATTNTPTYTLPAGDSALYLQGNTITRLTSGSPTSLQPGDYQYQAQYDGSSVSALGSFTITWSS